MMSSSIERNARSVPGRVRFCRFSRRATDSAGETAAPFRPARPASRACADTQYRSATVPRGLRPCPRCSAPADTQQLVFSPRALVRLHLKGREVPFLNVPARNDPVLLVSRFPGRQAEPRADVVPARAPIVAGVLKTKNPRATGLAARRVSGHPRCVPVPAQAPCRVRSLGRRAQLRSRVRHRAPRLPRSWARLISWRLARPATAAAGRLSAGIGAKILTSTDMRANKTVYVAPPIENSAVNSDIRRPAPFSALTVQFAPRTPAVVGTLLRGHKLGLEHSGAPFRCVMQLDVDRYPLAVKMVKNAGRLPEASDPDFRAYAMASRKVAALRATSSALGPSHSKRHHFSNCVDRVSFAIPAIASAWLSILFGELLECQRVPPGTVVRAAMLRSERATSARRKGRRPVGEKIGNEVGHLPHIRLGCNRGLAPRQ